MLSNRDLDLGLRSHSEKALSDGDRLLIRIEPDFEHLLRSFQLTDEPLELALLLGPLESGRAQFARPRASFVHQRRIGLSDRDHLSPLFPAHDGSDVESPDL